MKILVCIKQVPGTTNVNVDPVTGVLIRDGVESKMNPYDMFALETAFRIREKLGGTITTISMGPPQTKEVLEESFYMGADAGCLLTDRKFGGADVLATSYTLAQGAKKLGGFDLIICGKQTTDGDTAQVGPEMAEYLGIPHVTNICKIDEIDEKAMTIEMNMENSLEIQMVPFPCLITVDKDIFTPRLPSFKRKLDLGSKVEIQMLTLKDMYDTDEKHYGLSGSATSVERIFPPEANTEKVMHEGTAKEMTTVLYDILVEQKYI